MLDEATGHRTPPTEWRSWATPTSPMAPARRRTGWSRTLLVGGLVAALLVAIAVLPRPSWPGSAEAVPSASQPLPGHEVADEPLGTPWPAPAGGGSHAFAALQDDGVTPVAYDPCRPVHYVVRPGNGPIGGDDLIHDAVRRVSEVTGLRFVHDGPTAERPSQDRSPYQPERYGYRWAPVVIAWETEAENPAFGTDVIGEAGSIGVSVGGGPRVYVTGGVSLDGATFVRLLATPEGMPIARAVVLHELAHLVGLDHVGDAGQLMYPTTSAVTDFAAGDLTGLAALGSGECEPDL